MYLLNHLPRLFDRIFFIWPEALQDQSQCRPVADILRKLTLKQEKTGPTQEEFDAFSLTAQSNEQCIAGLTMQVNHMAEGMANMESMQQLSHNALQELWKVCTFRSTYL